MILSNVYTEPGYKNSSTEPGRNPQPRVYLRLTQNNVGQRAARRAFQRETRAPSKPGDVPRAGKQRGEFREPSSPGRGETLASLSLPSALRLALGQTSFPFCQGRLSGHVKEPSQLNREEPAQHGRELTAHRRSLWIYRCESSEIHLQEKASSAR